MNKQTSLEAQIASAINNTNCNAATLAGLRKEAEVAISYAEKKLAELRVDVFDPQKYENPKEARAILEDTEFLLGRLQTLMPRLIQRLAVVEAAEQHDAWLVDYADLKRQRDEAADEFKEAYSAGERIAKAAAACVALDEKLSQLHQRRQSNCPLHLDSAELVARGMTEFSADRPSLLKTLVLPSFSGGGGNNLWPPKSNIASALLPPAAYGFADPYSGTADWWRKGQQAAEQQQLQNEQKLREAEIAKNEFYGLNGRKH